MQDILFIIGMLALSIWFFKHNKQILKEHIAQAEEAITKGIDVILPDGRRVIDESVEFSIPHQFAKNVMGLSRSTPPYVYLGHAQVTAFHKLKDGTWLRQDAFWVGSRGLKTRSYTPVHENEVRRVLAYYPDQFTKAFGMPVVV